MHYAPLFEVIKRVVLLAVGKEARHLAVKCVERALLQRLPHGRQHRGEVVPRDLLRRPRGRLRPRGASVCNGCIICGACQKWHCQQRCDARRRIRRWLVTRGKAAASRIAPRIVAPAAWRVGGRACSNHRLAVRCAMADSLFYAFSRTYRRLRKCYSHPSRRPASHSSAGAGRVSKHGHTHNFVSLVS